jgi:hypothetical protein
MKLLKELLFPAIFSIVFIFLTGWVAFSLSFGFWPLKQFCFFFHIIPFGMGFSGGIDTFTALIYYPILWLVLTVFFLGIRRIFSLLFKRAPRPQENN